MSNIQKAAVTELKVYYASSKTSAQTCVNARDFYSLSYRYEGKIMVESGGERMYSGPGSITFIPKGLPYTTEIVEDMKMAVVHFKLDRDIDFRNAAVISAHDAGIHLLFDKLIRAYHVNCPVDFQCMSVFYEILSRLEHVSQLDGFGAAPDKIRAVREYIEQNFRSREVYIEFLAQKFSISTSYLRREFSRAYGISPVAFLRTVRVENAKNMLESGCLSVDDIAEQCGFSSTSYFIQVFHKTVGESPDKYRRRLRD